jgi:2-dehydro-3-deoxygluconokinase
MTKIVAVGEIMIELSNIQKDGQAKIGCGGDTGNTAVYLARLFGDKGNIGYLTRLGQGAFADRVVDFLRSESVAVSPVASAVSGAPGLYAIHTDDEGERSFSYWRKDAAVRDLFAGENNDAERAFALAHDALYLSGITLAVLRSASREALFDLVAAFKQSNRPVMFDVNLRANLWASHDPDADIRALTEKMIGLADIVKIGCDEGEALFSIGEGGKIVDYCVGLGAKNVVVTDGPGQVFVGTAVRTEAVQFQPVEKVVDSTAAGDSFSAGFFHAFLNGAALAECAKSGQALAAKVIQHTGAIIPKAAM